MCVLQDFFVDEAQLAVNAGTADDGAADLVVIDCYDKSNVRMHARARHACASMWWLIATRKRHPQRAALSLV